MSDKAKKLSPPYATFSSFINFLNKLRETTVPNRIDPSLFGNASGSISYSVIAALKYLKLIDTDGKPNQRFIKLVNASDEERKPLFREVVKVGYPSLFADEIDLASISAGQFDEHIRKEFEVQGSTVDKIAAFFIAAAKTSGIEISPHLAARKPVHASSSSNKSKKQRKRDTPERDGDPSKPADDPPALNQERPKALEYQLIDLMSEPDIDQTVKDSIWSLVQYLMARKAKNED